MTISVIDLIKDLSIWDELIVKFEALGVTEYVIDPTLTSVEQITIDDGKIYIPPQFETLVSELLKSK